MPRREDVRKTDVFIHPETWAALEPYRRRRQLASKLRGAMSLAVRDQDALLELARGLHASLERGPRFRHTVEWMSIDLERLELIADATKGISRQRLIDALPRFLVELETRKKQMSPGG